MTVGVLELTVTVSGDRTRDAVVLRLIPGLRTL